MPFSILDVKHLKSMLDISFYFCYTYAVPERRRKTPKTRKATVMKSDYKVRAEKFIRRMYPIIKGCRTPVAVSRCIRQYNQEHHTNIQVANGAARYVLIYSDYVIKFDYGNDKTWAGGCEDEYQRYQNVIKGSGYEYLFAEMTKIRIGRKNIYIMPRVRGIGHSQYYWNKLTYAEHCFISDVTADMHRGNYGNFNRKPKIVDYAMAP